MTSSSLQTRSLHWPKTPALARLAPISLPVSDALSLIHIKNHTGYCTGHDQLAHCGNQIETLIKCSFPETLRNSPCSTFNAPE